jgi:hypothetical protein
VPCPSPFILRLKSKVNGEGRKEPGVERMSEVVEVGVSKAWI